MPTKKDLAIKDKLLAIYTDPVSLSLMVYPVALPNGQTYDLTTVLTLYLKEYSCLTAELKEIECPTTRDKIEINPDKIKCHFITKNAISALVNSLDPEQNTHYTTLPEDRTIVDYMLNTKGISESACLNYLKGITQEEIKENYKIYTKVAIWAAKNGHTETTKTLFNLDPKLLNAKDQYGNTPACYAEREGHTETVQMLESIQPSKPAMRNHSLWKENNDQTAMRKTDEIVSSDSVLTNDDSNNDPNEQWQCILQ
jgi:hypothetical protein